MLSRNLPKGLRMIEVSHLSKRRNVPQDRLFVTVWFKNDSAESAAARLKVYPTNRIAPTIVFLSSNRPNLGGQRHFSEKSSPGGQNPSCAKKSASSVEQVNENLKKELGKEEDSVKASSKTGVSKSDSSSQQDQKDERSSQHSSFRDPESQKIFDADPHDASTKPDPKLMWKVVPPEEASADTGGYVKLEDIGFDPQAPESSYGSGTRAEILLQDKKSTSTADQENKTRGSLKTSEKTLSVDEKSTVTADQEKHKTRGSVKTSEKTSSEKNGSSKDESAQKTLVEGTKSGTTGAQASSDGGGVGHLTEQLMDRETADQRSVDKKLLDRNADADAGDSNSGSSSGSDSDSDSDSESDSSSSDSDSDRDSSRVRKESDTGSTNKPEKSVPHKADADDKYRVPKPDKSGRDDGKKN